MTIEVPEGEEKKRDLPEIFVSCGSFVRLTDSLPCEGNDQNALLVLLSFPPLFLFFSLSFFLFVVCLTFRCTFSLKRAYTDSKLPGKLETRGILKYLVCLLDLGHSEIPCMLSFSGHFEIGFILTPILSPTQRRAVQQIERLLQLSRRPSDFEVLGIPPDKILDVTTDAITKAYRRLTLLLHPDKCDHPQAAAAFTVVQRSYNILKQQPVLEQLQRTEAKRREAEAAKKHEREEAEAEAAAARKRAKSESDGPPLGQRCRLNAKGISTDEQKSAEIERVLCCRANDYFGILDLDPDSGLEDDGKRGGVADGAGDTPTPGSTAAVTRRYRRVAQALHPDKCELARAADAFTRVERAYQELKDDRKFIRYKAQYHQEQRKAAAMRAQFSRLGMAEPTGPPKTFEERQATALREQVLEAARLAQVNAAKKKKAEEERAAQAKLSAELQRQRQEWKSMML
eukprot:gene7857-5484_t